ncbi:BTAD domain-containing putative transcriptional regulator [Actinacidiphila glaucinigra]|uniref:AfsR/SARP family transcriptional regulator n=1 Tax=Actinacidiphila glaucinigra TaxID=235986 RepID=UPI002DD82729|nr:BTAD domain-containing putative transcriptional regulator [Actinacidiphila glaucinigra]WSD57631.1 tetratricopeptide repeat protein [Actinacidiphila glaucinigra]
MAVEFGLLGTIEARVDGRLVDVGHIRQRSVLAALLTDATRTVPVDELVDRVWGDRVPQRGKETLYGYMSRLRRALRPAGEVRIVRRPGGYVLEVDPATVDMHRFRGLVAQARTAGDEQAAAMMRQALGLWRGEPFATVDTPWFHDLRQALERERFSAELEGTDLRLRSGLHGELLPELTTRHAEHPLDERLGGQLMLALSRSGRPAEALTCYQGIRRRLAEELGIDPGAPLRQLHQRILSGDPALALPDPTPNADLAPRGVRSMPTPRQLPARFGLFTGREQQLAELDKALDSPDEPGGTVVISAIGGSGGIGKTRLALHWAYERLDRFPDGQLYVDLRGFDTSGEPVAPAVVVRGFLDALGVESGAVPLDLQAQSGLYRSLVQERRMLIVLDNAADAEQAAALLPGGAGCVVLVTSRRRLVGLASAHGARLVTLDVLSHPEARELLVRHLGQDRTAAEPDAVAALLEHCGGLPLAISIVGARAAVHPDFPLAVLAEELKDESARLDALDAGDLTADVRAAFTVSYRALTAGAAEVFRHLGLASGPEIGQAAIVSLVARPVSAVRAALRELENAHLVQQPVPGRYRLHDLVRLYAAERAREESAGSGDEALLRLVDFYLHTACAAAALLDPHRDRIRLVTAMPGVTPQEPADHGAALDWFTTEYGVLRSTIDMAAAARFDRQSWQLAWAMETFFDYRGHWHDWVTSQRIALKAAERIGNRSWQAAAHRSLASVHTQMGLPDGHHHFRQALDLYRELGDLVSQAHTHRGFGWLCDQQGRRRDALDHAQQALALYQRTGHLAGQAKALNNVGWLHITLSEHRAALEYCAQAVDLNQKIGDRHGEAGAWDSLGYAHHHLAEYTAALDCYRRALELDRGFGDRYGETEILNHLGDTHLAAGDPEQAGLAWRQALNTAEEIGHPAAEELWSKLGGLSQAGPARRGSD